jgi:hypothetical protein
MESDFLDFMGGLFEDAAWFPGCGWLMLFAGIVWASAYVGGQLTLADVQACQQAHAQCSVHKSDGFLHVPRRELIVTAPAAASAPMLHAPAGQRLAGTPQGAAS